MMQEPKQGPQISPQELVTTLAIQALPMREKADLQALQKADQAIGTFKSYWQRAKRPSKQELTKRPQGVRKLVQQWDRVCLRDGVLYRHIRPPNTAAEVFQLLLPECLKGEVLKHIHDDHGHQGIERTTHLVRERCFWPHMWQDIEKYCQNCNRCLVAKANQLKVRTFPGNIMASQPLEILAIDFTVLEKAGDGRENVLVITNVFSKFTQVYPTLDQKANTTAQILTEKWFYVY